jgi:hypothetical protein
MYTGKLDLRSSVELLFVVPVRIATVVTLQPSYLIGLGSWNGGNCIPATQYLWGFKLPKGFPLLRSTIN